jgi:hypothetical protein
LTNNVGAPMNTTATPKSKYPTHLPNSGRSLRSLSMANPTVAYSSVADENAGYGSLRFS